MAEDIKQQTNFKDDLVPMICTITRDQILEVVNNCFKPTHQIPYDAEITVRVPGGGDYSGMDLTLDNKDVLIDIRWKRRGMP